MAKIRRCARAARWPSVVALGTCLLLGPALAEDWRGTISIGYVGQDSDGNEASFRSQTGLDEGFFLDDLTLSRPADEPGGSAFELSLRGFGDVEGSEFAHLSYRASSPWTFELDYDRRVGFFALTETGLGLRQDDWDLSRWRGSVEYGGWKAADLALDLRYYDRGGSIERPIYAQGDLYSQRVDLDETMTEVAFRLRTKTLPVQLDFEQTWTVYERDNRYSGGGTPLDGESSNILVGQTSGPSDEIEAPTSRLVATWATPGVEVAGQLLYSPAELDARGGSDRTFAIEGGSFGSIQYVDDLIGSADMDTLAANLRLGFQLASKWELRVLGEYRDRSTDAALLGTRLLRLTNPFGQVIEIPALADDSSVLDITEDEVRAEVHWTDRKWSAWGGGFVASRDTSWNIGDRGLSDVTRDTEGFVLGLGYRPSSDLRISGEWERGDFDEFAFRNEPETVDRYKLNVNAGLGGGWELGLQGKVEDGDNPRELAGLDHSMTSAATYLSWGSEEGTSNLGFGLDWSDIDTRTFLVLPGGLPGLSQYDLELLTATAWGQTELGPVRLGGNLVWLDDSGDTWPLQSWNGGVRVGFDIFERAELSLFGEYWDFDEERANGDDYQVTRYGATVRWSWQ